MARYVLFVRNEGAQDPETVIVKDSFSVVGLIVPVVWLLWNRMWVAAVLAFALLALSAAAAWYFAMPVIALALDILVSAYVAVEGPALRMQLLRWAGWREAGIAYAPDKQEAELRLFAAYLDERPTAALPAKTSPMTLFGKSKHAVDFAFPSRG